MPEQFRAEAQEGNAVRAMLAGKAPQGLGWIFISRPAASGRTSETAIPR